MNYLWNDHIAQEATGGKMTSELGQGHWHANRVVIDSRQVQKGDLFVAIKGENFDGHQFVAQALSKGAVAAMVSHIPADCRDAPLLLVSDTLKALGDLGTYARRRSMARVVGVTGSVGKTSTKEMLKLVLAAHGSVYATGGNYNNHIGTPLNLANLPEDTQFAVFEMGMNHAGEIAHLTKMVQPNIAAITNVEAVHMEFFMSLDAIGQAKSEIFQGMGISGVAVVNLDSPQFPVMKAAIEKEGIPSMVTFGAKDGADCRLLGYGVTPEGSKVTAYVHGKVHEYTMKAVGRHWAITSLLVLAVSHALGLDDAVTISALSQFGELEGRGHMVPLTVSGGKALLIDDSYNASPAAMRAAFAKTAEIWQQAGSKGRKIAALGNMLELGSGSAELHAGLAEGLAAAGFDAVFTAGDLMAHLRDALPEKMRAGHVEKASELLPLLRKFLKADDVVLVKGSHGSKMYELAKSLRDESQPKEAA